MVYLNQNRPSSIQFMADNGYDYNTSNIETKKWFNNYLIGSSIVVEDFKMYNKYSQDKKNGIEY